MERHALYYINLKKSFSNYVRQREGDTHTINNFVSHTRTSFVGIAATRIRRFRRVFGKNTHCTDDPSVANREGERERVAAKKKKKVTSDFGTPPHHHHRTIAAHIINNNNINNNNI